MSESKYLGQSSPSSYHQANSSPHVSGQCCGDQSKAVTGGQDLAAPETSPASGSQRASSVSVLSSVSSSPASASLPSSCPLLCPVRISFAYIFRIRLGDQYLLLGSKDGKSAFKPIGGGYRFCPETLDAIQTRFGYYPASGKGVNGANGQSASIFHAKTNGAEGESQSGTGIASVLGSASSGQALEPEAYDYRLLIEGAQLADFVHCFNLGEGYNQPDAVYSNYPDPACEYAQLQALSYALQYSGDLPRVRPEQLRVSQSSQESQWRSSVAGAETIDSVGGLRRDRWRRENILDLRRELQEELVESEIFSTALGPESGAAALESFVQLHYRYIGRYYDGIADLRFSCGALMLTDIVELVPTTEQLKALEALSTAWGKHEPLQGLYAWVAAKDFRGHLVPRGSQIPSSMDELLADIISPQSEANTTNASSKLRLADHCALLLTPYTVIPPSVQQCLHELAKHAAPVAHAEHTEYDVNTDLIITPRGWLVTH